MEKITCSFYGFGLIGGSIAMALKKAFPDICIKAYDKEPRSLEAAYKSKTADRIYSALTGDYFECDYLFLCAPVSENDEFIRRYADELTEGCVLTDVGSVKKSTAAAATQAGLTDRYIGGHPMAGSEKTGFSNAGPQLLENAYYILTPLPDVVQEKTDALFDMITAIGALPLIMTPERHDHVTGGISHLPHVISAALVNFIRQSDDENGLMKMVAAGGFKDITRISSSSPEMWKAICMTNTDEIASMLEDYIKLLSDFSEKLKARDPEALTLFFSDAKQYRDSFSHQDHGPIKKIADLYVDIPDVPGSIAQTATILALNFLSIKNIGIMHSREFQEGALRIEFYDEETAKKAAVILTEHNYRIFR
ncbi:MAG: prephenate dehydrogenase [Lachnospiraceae bacterium]|nr:prephenate dehydrogenase [Lachnospiraceae bacterium]